MSVFSYYPCVRAPVWFFFLIFQILKDCSTKKRLKTFFSIYSKNQISVVAVDELIIFSMHVNFPKCLFFAVEVLEVDQNVQKITFFIFIQDMGYEMRKTISRVRGIFFDIQGDLSTCVLFHIWGVLELNLSKSFGRNNFARTCPIELILILICYAQCNFYLLCHSCQTEWVGCIKISNPLTLFPKRPFNLMTIIELSRKTCLGFYTKITYLMGY